MILLLVRVLLWLAAGYLVYWLLLKFIPKSLFTFIGGALVFVVILLAFYEPSQQIPEAIWQVLILPFKPLTLALFLLIVTLVGIFRGADAKSSKTLLSFAVVCLFLLSMPVISKELVRTYEHGSAVAAQRFQNIPTSLIVLLGQDTTRVNLPGGSNIQLTDRGDRLLYTAQLYNAQSRPNVIVSAGVRQDLAGEEKDRFEAEDIERFLRARGVPEGAIILDRKSRDIRSSAENIAKLLEERNLEGQQILLVTSAINMARSYFAFKKEGLNVIPQPTDFYSYSKNNEALKPEFQVLDVIPSIDALYVSTKVVEDFFGTVYYFLRGWLTLEFSFYTCAC